MSDNQHDLIQEEKTSSVKVHRGSLRHDTSPESELPCGEPVEMVYGGVCLPGIAFVAWHPVHQRGENVECVADGANNQACNLKN